MAADNGSFPLKELPSATASPVNSRESELGRAEHGARKPITRDEADLAHFGKKQQLRRNFGMVSIIGLTCTLMITWEGLLSVFVGGFMNGGPTGLVVGYLLSWFGVFTQTMVMAEMGSMIPLSGGQYNWVAVLAPRSCYKFLSYLTGWITVIAWHAITASGALICGLMLQGIAILNYPEYAPQRWQATLLMYAITIVAIFFNTYLARLLPQVESLILVVHVIGFFAILIPMVYLAPKGSVEDVFNTWINEGGWSTQTLSFFIGAVTTMFAFIGIDGATHMAEEIENASIVIPRSMFATVIINGILGFAMLIAVLFCVGDLEAALTTPTGFPFMQIILGATNSIPGATAMISILLITPIFASVGACATTSRMLWAFARENGLPFSKYLSRVDERTALPLWAIVISMSINVLLGLINIGSTVAFNALTGLTIAGFYSSFILSASVMLYKRLTTPDSGFRWGPFRLGKFGIPLYIISICYSVIGMFFSFWPPTAEVDAVSMNWSVVVYFGTILLALVYWFLYARHIYIGPIVEIEQVDGDSNKS